MITRSLRLSLAAAAAVASVLTLAVPAQAVAPPPTWTNQRVLDCGADGILTTYLAPPGIGTPFNVVGSTDVLIPVKLVVTGTVNGVYYDHALALYNPAFDHNRAATVECTYTDPIGLYVEMTAHIG